MIQGATLVAIAFSAWAALGSGSCASCDGAAALVPGKSLAAVGVVYYSILFIAAVTLGPSLFVYSGVLLAAGIHAGLLAVLAHAKIFCAPCVGTALAALAALVFTIRCDSTNALRASLLIPVAAGLVQVGVLVSGAAPALAQSRVDTDRVVHEDLAGGLVAPGQVRMVVYTRPDCGYCIQLERDVLPGLVRDYGTRLSIERRSAAELPGIPTPTLILSGSAKRRLIPGLPEAEDLRSVINELMGESHGHETVLEKSR
jgi:hypothetical protein